MKKGYLNKLKTGIPYGLGNLALGIYSRDTLACVHALGEMCKNAHRALCVAAQNQNNPHTYEQENRHVGVDSHNERLHSRENG